MKKKYEIDMSEGPILAKLIKFAVPIMLSGFLQLAFNTADLIVVGNFAGENALAAVGSNSSLISLVVNILLGLGTGTSVLASRFFGAKDEKALGETVSTTVIVGAVGGVVFAFLGILLAEPLLTAMGTPPEVLPLAAVYLRIYFGGMPVIVLYNFTSAVLRAVGDSRRPLYFLALSGVINVGLNLFFVLVCGMDVDGVAIATVISEGVSCILTVSTLLKSRDIYRLNLKKYGFSLYSFKQIARIGLPAGIQGSLFSISNVIIQSSINSFGAMAMAGNSAASSLESFAFTAQDSVNQSAIASVSQNMGARKYDRTKKCVLICTLMNVVSSIVLGSILIFFRYPLVSIYTSEPAAMDAASWRILIMSSTFALNALQHMFAGVLRGHGYSLMPTIVSLLGICGFRIFWVYVVFSQIRTLECLYTSYPISWILTFGTQLILYFIFRNRAFAANEKRTLEKC